MSFLGKVVEYSVLSRTNRQLICMASSMGRCNTICDNVDLRGGVYGTNRAPRACTRTDGGVMAAVESWAVDERHRTCTRPRSVSDSLRGALPRRDCSGG